MTASNSSTLILWKKRSRRMPALLTTASMRPKASSAVVTMRCAAAASATLSVLATASPPAARISSTTCCAGPASVPSPVIDAPRSLTTTFAPSRAIASAMSRPMPPPAPVTTTTLPSIILLMHLLLSGQRKPAGCLSRKRATASRWSALPKHSACASASKSSIVSGRAGAAASARLTRLTAIGDAPTKLAASACARGSSCSGGRSRSTMPRRCASSAATSRADSISSFARCTPTMRGSV